MSNIKNTTVPLKQLYKFDTVVVIFFDVWNIKTVRCVSLRALFYLFASVYSLDIYDLKLKFGTSSYGNPNLWQNGYYRIACFRCYIIWYILYRFCDSCIIMKLIFMLMLNHYYGYTKYYMIIIINLNTNAKWGLNAVAVSLIFINKTYLTKQWTT